MPLSNNHQAVQPKLLPVGAVCEIVDAKTGNWFSASILSRRWGSSSNPSPGSDTDNVQYYVHRHDQDKRMDGWLDHASVRPTSSSSNTDRRPVLAAHLTSPPSHSTPVKSADRSSASFSTTIPSVEKGKRKAEHDLITEGSDGSRTPSGSRQASPTLPDRSAHHRGRHKASTSDTPALRNIDRVLYGNFDIKTWYHSPYPLDHDDDAPDSLGVYSSSSSSVSIAANKRNQSPATLRLGVASSAAAKRAARKDSANGLGGASSTFASDAFSAKSLPSSTADPTASSLRHSPASPSTSNNRSKKDVAPTKMLWICDGCFKYMKTYNGFAAHRKLCRYTHPPGRKVYQRGAHIIWQVDGAAEKLYCQNLSLFGKLFIDHKTIYFDVEPFLFYVLTDAANASFDHPLGFFSKEKISYDDYNLACIVTFPPFQRKSFGTLMIEFSYYLSAMQGMLGTPERPLSDLGFKGYLSFWTAVLLRALSCCFDGPLRIANDGGTRQRRASSAIKPDAIVDAKEAGSDAKSKAEDALRQWQMLTQRCKLLNTPIESISHQHGFTELQQLAAEADRSQTLASSSSATAMHKRKLRLKGWAGSTPSRPLRQPHNGSNGTATQDPGAARRSSRVAANSADATAVEAVHPALDISLFQKEGMCTMAVTVEALSRLTHLRSDDIVLALSEAGLIDATNTPFLPTTDEAITLHSADPIEPNGDTQARNAPKRSPTSANLALLLTRDAIRETITRFNIRPAVLDESYALI